MLYPFTVHVYFTNNHEIRGLGGYRTLPTLPGKKIHS